MVTVILFTPALLQTRTQVAHIKHKMSLKIKAIKEIHNKHRDVKRGLNTRNEAKRNATIAAHVFLFAFF